MLALAAAGRDGHLRTAWPAAVSGLVIFAAAPQWWFDHEPHWALWQQAAGDSYVLFAAGVLIMSVRMRSSTPASIAKTALPPGSGMPGPVRRQRFYDLEPSAALTARQRDAHHRCVR